MNSSVSQDKSESFYLFGIILRSFITLGLALVEIYSINAFIENPISYESGLILLVTPYLMFEVLVRMWDYITNIPQSLQLVAGLGILFAWIAIFGTLSIISLGVIPILIVVDLLPIQNTTYQVFNWVSTKILGQNEVFASSSKSRFQTRVESMDTDLVGSRQTNDASDNRCPDCSVEWNRLLVGRYCPNCGREQKPTSGLKTGDNHDNIAGDE